MQYYPHLWNTLRFLVTPKELEEVLSGFHHVVYTHRVPADYVESERSIFFEAYQALYDKLQSGKPLVWQKDLSKLDISTGLSNDLTKSAYKEAFQDPKDGKFYKTSDFAEPCVGINPFVLKIAQDGKLQSNLSYIQFPEFVVGLEIQYPKNIIYYKDDAGEEEERVPCRDLPSFEVYQEITGRLKAFTKNLSFQVGDRSYKTTIKISEKAKVGFYNFYFAKHFGVQEGAQ